MCLIDHGLDLSFSDFFYLLILTAELLVAPACALLDKHFPTSNYNNQQMHMKRVKNYTQHINFLYVSAPGRHLQGFQSTQSCKYQNNTLGFAATKR